MNPFQSLREYEIFVYTLSQRFPSILHSTLIVIRRGRLLAELTDPHHKHVPPDIKHHRIPAPGLSFAAANLPLLIHEIETSLLQG
jgi:hypothetical protein